MSSNPKIVAHHNNLNQTNSMNLTKARCPLNFPYYENLRFDTILYKIILLTPELKFAAKMPVNKNHSKIYRLPTCVKIRNIHIWTMSKIIFISHKKIYKN